MAEKDGEINWVMINRAPVLTFWAGVVAEVLGFEHDEALTLAGRRDALGAVVPDTLEGGRSCNY